MAVKLKDLKSLLVHELKDLYNAEKQLVEALPKMQKNAANKQLATAFKDHLVETKEHIKRLEKVFKQLDYAPTGSHCDGMEGLIEEGEEIIKEKDVPSDVKDAALICAAQRVEHYEMAGYGCARTFARVLGLNDIADILQTTLDEEGAADQKLTSIAETSINAEAASV